jgi:hypothetical protein
MSAVPEPEPGLAIRYDYLWSREAAAGREHGRERPPCLVAASDDSKNPRFVVILPVTHARPRDGTVGVEIPQTVRTALGLDDSRCWVIVSEYNVDEWPNGGLTPVPGRGRTFGYGFVPPRLFAKIKSRFLELRQQGSLRGTRR